MRFGCTDTDCRKEPFSLRYDIQAAASVIAVSSSYWRGVCLGAVGARSFGAVRLQAGKSVPGNL